MTEENCTKIYICDRKIKYCQKRFCGDGFCYHTSDASHAVFGSFKGSTYVRKWVKARTEHGKPDILIEVKRKCTHPEISMCDCRQFDFSDPEHIPTSKESYCIRGRCVAHDRTRRTC